MMISAWPVDVVLLCVVFGILEMNKVKRLAKQQLRRKHRVRNKLKSGGRVRLSVFRSNLYFRCQAIDDKAFSAGFRQSTFRRRRHSQPK